MFMVVISWGIIMSLLVAGTVMNSQQILYIIHSQTMEVNLALHQLEMNLVLGVPSLILTQRVIHLQQLVLNW